MWNVFWSTSLRRTVTSIAALITAIASSIVAVPPAWTALGLPEVASKTYVHSEVEPVRLAQSDTTRAVYLLTLNQLQSSLYAAQQDQIKNPSATVDQRVQDLKSQIDAIQAKIAGH